MATKYGFTKALKEVRFLFCQTSEHSAATRSVGQHHKRLPFQCGVPYAERSLICLQLTCCFPSVQGIPHTHISYHEEAQPHDPHHAARSPGHPAQGVCEVRSRQRKEPVVRRYEKSFLRNSQFVYLDGRALPDTSGGQQSFGTGTMD